MLIKSAAPRKRKYFCFHIALIHPFNEIADRRIGKFERHRVDAIATLKKALEAHEDKGNG